MTSTPSSSIHDPDKFLNALAENYLLQDAILGATELVVISTALDGTITSINTVGEPMLGYTSLELIGKMKLSVFHDRSELQRHMEELSGSGFIVSDPEESLFVKASKKITDQQEWTYRRKDGSIFPVNLSITGIWNDKAELTGFLAIAADVTEKRKSEIARNESERKFRLLAENLQATIYLCRNDETYSMIYLNEQVQALTGYSSKDFISGDISFVNLYHEDDKEEIFKKVEDAIAVKKSFSLHYRLRHASGEWRWIDETGIGIYEGDELQMLEGFMTDVTERKRAEDELTLSKINLEVATHELREQNQQLNEFAHIISHNLRSPVGNIGALISLLSDKSTLDEYQTIFEKLKTASGNLKETLNDLMETLRIREEGETEKTGLVFADVFNKVREGFAGDIIQSKATVTSDFSACRTILYSKTYLESIFLNLLSNAIKYRSPNRTLKVHFQTFLQDGKEMLRVTDNARGIDLERYGHQLFNLRKTFHEHKDARGVGLFLTKTQVEAMGGKISAESEVDKGTVFTLRFN